MAHAVQVTEALQHLHARGIMHMDVKPDNIYTASGGTYKLGDFGLATCRGSCGQAQLQEGDSRLVTITSLLIVTADHRLDSHIPSIWVVQHEGTTRHLCCICNSVREVHCDHVA